MRTRHRFTAALLALALFAPGCASHAPPGGSPPALTPTGKAAYYGEKFLALVEQAQDQTIKLADGGTLTRPQVEPAVRVFVAIGKAGQRAAQGLRAVDAATDAVQKAGAAAEVDAAVLEIQTLLLGVAKDLSNDTARARVLAVVDGLRVGAALLDVLRVVAPYLPLPAPKVASSWPVSGWGVPHVAVA